MSSASTQTHSRLIQQAAKEILSPLGIFQRGRSRIWIDDRGWWIIVIEFQPSSWSKGSYLNVGAMWLWNEREHLAFDAGNRVEKFVGCENEEQFAVEARRLALSARKEVLRLRKQFSSLKAVAKYLKKKALKEASPWQLYHAGVALGYTGQVSGAGVSFSQLMQQETDYEWQRALHATAQSLSGLLNDPCAFKERVDQTVLMARKTLKLPKMEDMQILYD